jgi:hypothetical protein
LHREIKWNCLELNYSNQISAFLTVWAQWGLARQKLELQASLPLKTERDPIMKISPIMYSEVEQDAARRAIS